MKEVQMSRLPMPTSDAPIAIDLTCLSPDDMRLGDDFIGTADLGVRQEADAAGPFTLLDFRPKPGMSEWITAIVGLPQFEVTYGLFSVELEAWNPGVPLRVVVDATDTRTKCFEIGFCPNDTVWNGWKTFTVPLVGEARGEVSSEKGPIVPPVRLKWLIVIMRQGLAWQLGLRSLRIKPIRGPVPEFRGK
jgi:hypothetical protein